jgi:hypothetical protein
MLLGVPPEATYGEVESSWHDTIQADTLDQEEGKDIARQRYQRMFWEAVPDGSVCSRISYDVPSSYTVSGAHYASCA